MYVEHLHMQVIKLQNLAFTDIRILACASYRAGDARQRLLLVGLGLDLLVANRFGHIHVLLKSMHIIGNIAAEKQDLVRWRIEASFDKGGLICLAIGNQPMLHCLV